METGLTIMKWSFCFSLLVVVSCAQAPAPWSPADGMRPGTCYQYECPTYKLLERGYGYEIRAYHSTAWMSTGPIPSPSIIEATKTGYQRLSSYISGDNKRKEKFNMTSPVITQATPGKQEYTVFFYLAKKNQQTPPEAEGLKVQRWKPSHVAVRQIGDVTDEIAKKEVVALIASLEGSKWIAPINKQGKSPAYLVADYNPPLQTDARVSEILIPFNM